MIERTQISWTRGVTLMVGTLLLFIMVTAASAEAKPYEQVGTFGGVLAAGEVNEESQLDGASALAVNYTGAGGVAKGTVYAIMYAASEGTRIARFEPVPGGLKFVERWDLGYAGPEKELCGPAVVSESLAGKEHCSMTVPPKGVEPVGIAVDQTTGNVYASQRLSAVNLGGDVISVYSPNGTERIATFGEKGPSAGEHVTESPAKIHGTIGWGVLTVNSAGEVFYLDYMVSDNFYHRLMVFKPKTPGVYADYEYAGISHDVGAGFYLESNLPEHPVVDAEGNIYVAGEGTVEEYDPGTPNKPICTFTFAQGGIYALAVNPSNGEPFFYSFQKRPRRIHELSGCENGVFHETGETEVAPERAELKSLIFDPTRQFSAGRQPGVLYGAASEEKPVVGPGQPGTSGLGYIFAQPKETPPKVDALTVNHAGDSFATLLAQVNPQGFPTHYLFRYLTQAAYEAQGDSFIGAIEAPLGGASLAPSGGARQVEATVTGLEPDTAYVFQAVASSNCVAAEPAKACTTESEPALFHTYPNEPPGLPEGRAYELVSPADKQGGEAYPLEPKIQSCLVNCMPGEISEPFPVQSSPGGEAVVYEGEPFGASGAVIENEYLSKRTAGGWRNVTLAPSLLANRNGSGYKAFDPTLAVGVLRQGPVPLSGSTPGDFRNLYTQATADPATLTAVLGSSFVPTCSPGADNGSLDITYAGASTDLSRIFFEANDALTADSSGSCGQSNLYEWAAGEVRAVNLPPSAATSVPGAVFGAGWLMQNSASAAIANTVSADGSRAFFTGADGKLYVRLDGATTLEVPGPGNCEESVPVLDRVCFLTASADGSRVLLSDGQVYELNGAETAYEPSVALAQGKGGFKGIAGQSEDLSHVYFVDTADLTGGEENDQGSTAQAGATNLYAWVEGSTRFVGSQHPLQDQSNWSPVPATRTAEASPAGRWLAFQSVLPLTGYDNVGPCLVNITFVNAPCREAFLYDSQTGDIICASCNPSGAKPAGQTNLPSHVSRASTGIGALPQPRYLNDAGRLFFDTSDRLLPSDTNGRIEDLYEYEPTGVGGCAKPGHCLHLISAGRGSADSQFLAMDKTGDNVFFTTRDRLVGADIDELVDVYDARVGGGFTEPAPPTECKVEACQQPTAPPPQESPASMALPAEKSAQPGCKKGQVKRKGRCVKKHTKRHSKKHHKQSGRDARKEGHR